jgi:hypothetical protein
VEDVPLVQGPEALLVAYKYRYPDDRIAIGDLLERWKVGLATTPAERRIVLRLSREQKDLDIPISVGTSSNTMR